MLALPASQEVLALLLSAPLCALESKGCLLCGAIGEAVLEDLATSPNICTCPARLEPGRHGNPALVPWWL